jgi:hypothetical protein
MDKLNNVRTDTRYRLAIVRKLEGFEIANRAVGEETWMREEISVLRRSIEQSRLSAASRLKAPLADRLVIDAFPM